MENKKDLIIIDDPIRLPRETASKEAQERVKEWYNKTVATHSNPKFTYSSMSATFTQDEIFKLFGI